MTKRLGVIATAVVLGLLGGHAFSDPSPHDMQDARAHYASGQAYYQHRQFDLAIAEFRAAYAHAPAPALLFNTAQAYRALHRDSEALRYFQAYLKAAPAGHEHAYVSYRIRELERTVEQTPTPGPALVSLVEPPLAPKPMVKDPPTVVSSHAGRGKRIAGIVTGAAGGALLAAGIYFSAQAVTKSNELSDLFARGGRWSAHYDDLMSEGHRDQHLATGFYVVGGAAVVTGGVLYYLGLRDEARRIAIAPSSKGLRVAFKGKF